MKTPFAIPTDPAPMVNEAAPLHSFNALLAPWEAICGRSPHLLTRSFGSIKVEQGNLLKNPSVCVDEAEERKTAIKYPLPRYLFQGPPGGGDLIRIGIFAGIHGDEPESAWGLTRLVSELEADPAPATGYALYLYPVCNPTGFADGTRHARCGLDLNREFWKGSEHPEVRLLESELLLHAFDGLITLHADDTSQGVYGYVKGAVLSEHLLEPALGAAERFLPRNAAAEIDGWPACRGIIYEGFQGMLQSFPGKEQPPFEITLEMPQRAGLAQQVEAFNAALLAILREYRQLIAFAQNI